MRPSKSKINVNRYFPARNAFRAVCLALAATLLAVVLLAGCSRVTPTPPSPPEPQTVTVVDPVELARFEYDGQLVTADTDRCVSPDGKHLLAAILGDEAQTMSAIPLPQEGSDPSLEGHPAGSPIDLYSVDTSWAKDNLVQWLPIGWLSNEKPVFIVHGWQNQGEHYGERGTAVMVGDLATVTVSPVAFMESPEFGGIVDEFVLTDAGTLIIRVSEKIWSVDVQSGAKRLIREDFPNYGPLFYFAISPKGDHAVYSLNEDDSRGIFIMDLATGDERPLLPAGDTLSFYPSWSPDGKYIMAYTAKVLPDPSGQGLQLYTLLPAEDGPFPAAQVLTVVDVQGNVVKTINPEDPDAAADGQSQTQGQTGQFLFRFDWLADSEHMVFVSGPVTLGKWGEVQSMDYTGVWIGDVNPESEPVQCADLLDMGEAIGGDINYIYPVSSLPDGSVALLSIHGADSSSIWKMSVDGPATKVTDGWWESARLRPYFFDSVVGVVGGDSGYGLQVVGPDDAFGLGPKTTSEWSILGHNGQVLIAATYDRATNDSVLYLYSMLKEVAHE